jgi:methionyl-tRNA formyltransferase
VTDKKRPLRVALLGGSGAPFFGYVLHQLLTDQVPVAGVLIATQAWGPKEQKIHEDRTAGRLPILPYDAFSEHQIPFYFVKDHRVPECVKIVQSQNYDVLVIAGAPRILKGDILNVAHRGVINCHPGMLPDYKGCTCVEWAIYHNEQVGNTVHFVNEKIDEGPIILQEGLFFSKDDTYVDVRVKVFLHGSRLLSKAVQKIAREDLTAAMLPKQPAEGRYFSVIDQEKMTLALNRLAKKEYAFQK